jgi:hypothetical protein
MSVGTDRIHHINFLVRDLDAAEQRYRSVLGLGPAIRDALPGRQVITAGDSNRGSLVRRRHVSLGRNG